MPAFCIRRRVGIGPAAWWPRWSGTTANYSLASGSSRPIWIGPPNVWRGSTTSVARQSSGSRKGRTPSNGSRCPVTTLWTIRLQLFVLAYNLGDFLRQAVLPRGVRHWTLTTLREKLIKIAAQVVRHVRQLVFQMAEVAVPRELFRAILEGIERRGLPATASG